MQPRWNRKSDLFIKYDTKGGILQTKRLHSCCTINYALELICTETFYEVFTENDRTTA